jgi:hypothetical protein
MRRTILFLATVALVLLLVGGVAASQNSSGGGDVSIQSTTQQASFTSGSGPTFLRVVVSDHGNLLSFESPQVAQSLGGIEGYVLCSQDGSTVHGYDYGSGESGFGAATLSQPNGAGTFPLTVTRNTSDGKFQLKQVWNKPDNIEKDVTVTMTLTNLSSTTISGVVLSRTGEVNAGGLGADANDFGTHTSDSALQWDDLDVVGPPAVGLMLTALTFGTAHTPYIENRSGWNPTGCFPSGGVQTPVITRQDLAMRVNYSLGNMAASASKTVKFEYGRM